MTVLASGLNATMATAPAAGGGAGRSQMFGMSSSELLGFGSLFQGLSGFASAYSQAAATQIQGAYQRQALEFNKEVAKMQAQDALDRGEQAVRQQRRQVRQILGSQRASLAGQGVAVNRDTAAQIQEDTAQFGELDVLQLRSNAWREAWGYRVQALQSGSAAQFTQMAASINQRNTLLTGGLRAATAGGRAGYYFSR